jgi:hypothetical protein
VERNAYSVALADVNADGRPDLIVANYGTYVVSVLLNATPAGASVPSFTAQQTFATSLNPTYVIAADINGDGKPDVIATSFESNAENKVSVLLNTTAPGTTVASFAAAGSFAVGAVPTSVAAADINGDGKSDLVVVNVTDNTVSVLFNDTATGAAAPSFADQHIFQVGASPLSVVATDTDGDGKPDLIVANGSGSTITLLRNTTVTGTDIPTFAAQSFPTGGGPVSVAFSDLNGDGKPDVISANAMGTVSVLLNTQYQVSIDAGQATGTIVHDTVFANGFD